MQLSHMYLSKALENVIKLAGNVAWIVLVHLSCICSHSMEDIIRRLSRKVEHYDEFLLEVDRKCVLADCFKIVNNCDFSPTKLMKVCTSYILT